MVLIGSGEDADFFRKLCHELNLEDRTEILCSEPEEAIAARFASLDVLVLPSRTTEGWKEQLGRVLIEAMAMGVPAIGSSSGAIPEVLGREDLVFDEDNLDRLVNILNRIQTDASWRRDIVDYGHHRARDRFTWDQFALGLRNFYHHLGLL